MNKNIEYTDEIDVISELVSDISDRVVKNDLPVSRSDISEQGERRENYVDIDAKIVRCKDCRWKFGSVCPYFPRYYTFPDDFCSMGERKKRC